MKSNGIQSTNPGRDVQRVGAARFLGKDVRNVTIALMTNARFSGGSVGLVIGHVAPEAFLGGPIALIEDGDTIVIDINTDRMDCLELDDARALSLT